MRRQSPLQLLRREIPDSYLAVATRGGEAAAIGTESDAVGLFGLAMEQSERPGKPQPFEVTPFPIAHRGRAGVEKFFRLLDDRWFRGEFPMGEGNAVEV